MKDADIREAVAVDMDALKAFLLKSARGDLLPWQAQVRAMKRFGLSCRQIEEGAFDLKLLPARYSRNREALSTEEQHRLFRSAVAVVGCGGLGGYVIEELARLGVGTIRVIDPDVFEEHNLNRQILCTIRGLGKAKVAAARARVAAVNPAVLVEPVQEALSDTNGADLLKGVQAVADTLDSVPTRIILADICETLGLPLVHGAIGGWYGQITTQMPGDRSVQKIYGVGRNHAGIEKTLGNPAFTPPVVASLEAAELCKVLLGHGSTLRRRVLFIDLRAMAFQEMAI
jgi:molybdopterin/thiamine biosynthesis adenylyltransferase